jgi:hypothetical protein
MSALEKYSVMAVVAASTLLVAMVLVLVSNSSPAGAPLNLAPESPACPDQGTVQLNGVAYVDCNVAISWEGVGFGQVEFARISLASVLFVVNGYNTMDCPVLNITGTEPSGIAFQFFAAPIPSDCGAAIPPVFSADHAVGAIWHQWWDVQLLVRSG